MIAVLYCCVTRYPCSMLPPLSFSSRQLHDMNHQYQGKERRLLQQTRTVKQHHKFHKQNSRHLRLQIATSTEVTHLSKNKDKHERSSQAHPPPPLC